MHPYKHQIYKNDRFNLRVVLLMVFYTWFFRLFRQNEKSNKQNIPGPLA